MKKSTIVLFLLASVAARGNPIDALGFGSRNIGMAGASTSNATDSSANYYNPAGLVAGKDLRIDIGYRYAQPLLKMNGHDVGVDSARGWEVGLDAPGHIGPFRFAVGILLWLPDQRLTRVRSLPFSQPRFVLFDNRLQRLLLSANLAIQIVPGLYVGGGLSFMSRTVGELFLKGSVAVSDPDQSALTTDIDVDLVAVRYPQAGILWQATRNVSFGITYRGKFSLELNQGFQITGNVGDPGLPPVISNGSFVAQTISQDLFQPWQLAGGVTVHLMRRLLVALDLTYAAWHEFPTPASDLSLKIDIGPVFTPKIMLPPPRTYPEPGFHDIVIPRIGIEWRAREAPRLSVDVRGGYSYEPTPVPSQVGESNLVDCDKHTFSLGLGLEFGKLDPILSEPLSLDAHFSATYLPTRVTTKLSPVDPVGDYTAGGTVLQIGLMLRTRF
jgi:long-chain fatty acid transport protein